MATFRGTIPDFQLANSLYVGATVSFFTVDGSGNPTATLATLYAAPTGTQTLLNPQALDSEGKFQVPVYIEQPVVASVVGATVGSHVTGVIGLSPDTGSVNSVPGLSVLHAVVRYADTTGNLIDDSPILIDDTGVMTGIAGLVIAPPAGGLGQGIAITQSAAGTAPALFYGLNKIVIVENIDATNVTKPNEAIAGFHVNLTSGGAATKGSRTAGWFELTMLADATISATTRDFVGMTAFAHSQVAMPATAKPASLYAINPSARLYAGASGWNALLGAEWDIGSDVAGVPFIIGSNLVNTGTAQASSLSVAYYAAAAGGSPGWQYAFAAGNLNGANAIATTGTFAKLLNAQNLVAGLDLSLAIFSSFAIATPGFGVGPTGGVAITGGQNIGLTVADGTVTGFIVTSALLTNSLAFGTTTNHPVVFLTANTSRLTISNAGAVRFNAYTAGALSTDASGNITAGVLSGVNGGTGLSSAAVGDIPYASATTPTWARLAAVAVGSVLVSAGANTAPAWSASPSLTSLTTPLLIGGAGTTGTQQTFKSTTGNGTTDGFAWVRGNNGATTAMLLNNTGLGIGSVAPDGLLTVNANTAATVAVAAGTNLHIVGADGVNNIQTFDAFGAQAVFAARRANTGISGKTALAANDIVFNININGWDSAAYVGMGSIQAKAAEAFTTSAHGSYFIVNTIPLGSIAPAESTRFHPSGGLGVGAATTDPGINNIGIAGVYKVSNTQVLGARITGYTAMTGSPDKATAYATGSVTLPQLAGRVAQLQADLTTHGAIGP